MSVSSSYFQNKNIINEETLRFEIHHLDLSLVNALRRLIISHVETVGFRTEPHTKNTINIIINTSSLHNEYLAHRLGMIPIGFADVKNYNPTEYKYVLNVQNTTNQIIDITTEYINVLKKSASSRGERGEGGEREEREDEFVAVSKTVRDTFFPPDPITKEYILINRLKPDTSGKKLGEHLHIEATAVVSNGKENARWSPVSESSFHNKIDDVKANEVLRQIKEQFKSQNNDSITLAEEKALENRFKNFEVARHFHVNSKNEPNKFIFVIESIGILKPKDIFLSALGIVSQKLSNFLVHLNKETSQIVDLSVSENYQNSVDIGIKYEDHTIGNLIQSHLNYYDEIKKEHIYKDKNDINFIGYLQPHPLDDKIVIRIGFTEDYELSRKAAGDFDRISEVKKFLNNYVNNIILFCKELAGEFEQF